MIFLAVIAFGVMLAVSFVVGCALAELEIWMKEREEHERTDKGHGDA